MRKSLLALVLSAGALGFAPASVSDAPLRGFFPASVQAQRQWEARFQAIPDPARLRSAMQLLSARPHHLGSEYGRHNAEWIRDQFRSYGWQAEIETFEVLFPTPLERIVELVEPTIYRATLAETPLAVDPTSGQTAEQLPTYVAYAVDGDVTAPLVFVNYGVPADYEELDRRGISVKGAIVIAKFGGSWRGIKPKVAAEHGAVGCIIYSDPADDGFAGGDVFPDGPMRPPQGVQRGSVADMPTYPGDPLTPFIGATKNAKRLPIAEAPTLTKIPTLPISYQDAQPLLAALRGPVAPASWRGGLPITYRIGPGPAKVHLRVRSDWSLKPLHNVIARLPGTTEADQWVIRGNHHDAWVNGARDPISGMVAELEEARALGIIYRQGWRPKRTIIYAAWDGEEQGLLGSTEWVETHREELERRAVAYLNTDSNGRGFLSMSGSHSLESFINSVAKDVDDPQTDLSIWKRAQLRAILNGSAEVRRETRATEELRISALGSGSDYTPFLQHAGIASLNLSFGGEDSDGIYHSIYDDFHFYTTFSDTSFVYGRALAQTVGTAVMRLASADILPFGFRNLAATVGRYTTELQQLRDTLSRQITERNTQIDEGVFAATSDPREPTLAPKRETPPPQLNFAPLVAASEALTAAAGRYDSAYARLSAAELPPRRRTAVATALRDVNQQLLAAERALTSAEGLKSRPWYRHLLYAPGFYTGYGVKTMPGAREAIEQREWSGADREIVRVAAAVQRAADTVNRIADQIGAIR